jgi:hypothetical protein
MTSRRWLGAAVAAAVAASVISAGASALAASSATHGNYRGPARPAHAAHTVITHQTNYRGPVQVPARAAAVHGSNLPAALTHHQPRAQRGSK